MANKFIIVLLNNQVLLRKIGKQCHLLNAVDISHLTLIPQVDSIEPFHIGEVENMPASIIILRNHDEITYEKDKFEFVPSKPYLDVIDTREHPLVFRALHLNSWHHNTKYCGRCGQELNIAQDESFAKICQQGHKIFPTYSPAIIVMVVKKNLTRDDEVLLVRKPTDPAGMYTHVAGFVDPGENFKEAVIREVKEETGVAVSNIKYVCDQSWPFPNGHMIAFQAEYTHGDIFISDTDEIEDAKWFSRDAVSNLKKRSGTNFSISNDLTKIFLNSSL